MRTELDTAQEKAVSKLASGKILCGGVGTGKSRVSLVYYYTKICGGELVVNGGGKYRNPKKLVPLYIITTAKKRDSLEWEREMAGIGLYKDSSPIVVDSWNNIAKYKTVKDSIFIFDEQRLVGSGVWVRSFLKIAKSNRWIMLTATPGDTWMDYAAVFIANGYYRNRTDFIDRHVVYERYSKYPKIKEYRGTAVLHQHSKKLLVDIPYERRTFRHRKEILVDHNEPKLKTVFRDRWDVFKNEPLRNYSAMAYTARKVVNSDPSRTDAVVDILRKHKRAIIFYNFDYELEMLRELHDIDGMVVAEWNGHKHEPVPEGDLWCYLVQYAAGREGWNCTSTDTMIFFSLNYSYKVVEQAEGRIDRRNTGFKDLHYYYLKSNSRVDSVIWKALKSKKTFSERVVFGKYFEK